MKPEPLPDGEISDDDESDPGFVEYTSKYRTLETLGHGGFSVVKKAVCLENNQFVAVKIVPLSYAQPAILEREIDIMKKIGRHPNILELFAVFTTKKNVYIVMELATGGEVFDHIVNHGEYSERDASIVVRQIVEAIDYLHNQGIAHRDLFPQNLLCTGKGPTDIRLADFGLSKIFSQHTMMRTCCGSPEYVAPEVLQCTEYDHQVDMWSIGVIIYILLTGCFPFWHENVAELYKRILAGAYRWPDRPAVSDQAKDLVSKLLIKDPTARLTAKQCLDHPWIKGAAPAEIGERNWNDVQSRRHPPAEPKLPTTATPTTTTATSSHHDHHHHHHHHHDHEHDHDHSHKHHGDASHHKHHKHSSRSSQSPSPAPPKAAPTTSATTTTSASGL
ncbi:myosin light chain kinase [Pelomyxa schiedti]|nr:myosin light chain kinase [Pelomyxa schiedti]